MEVDGAGVQYVIGEIKQMIKKIRIAGGIGCIIFFLVVFVLFSGILYTSKGKLTTQRLTENILEHFGNLHGYMDSNVLRVKGGVPYSYSDSGITYGKAFEEFFKDPTWRYFKGTGGQDVVEFTGYCSISGENVKARLQFMVNTEDNTFETGALSFDDEPQNMLTTAVLVGKAFSVYAAKYGVETREYTASDYSTPIFSETEAESESTVALDVQQDAESQAPETENTLEVTVEADDSIKHDTQIFPESDRLYLTQEDVADTDAETIRYGLNEIYARHGRKFNDQELQAYFNAQSWYIPLYSPEEFAQIENSVFNEYEKENIRFLAGLIH